MSTVAREPAGASKLLIDLGPLLVFFLVNFFAPVPPLAKIFVATGAFMVAMIAAVAYSAIRFRHVSPLLWFSGIMVVLLGGLTLWTLLAYGAVGVTAYASAISRGKVTTVTGVTFAVETVVPSLIGLLALNDSPRPGFAGKLRPRGCGGLPSNRFMRSLCVRARVIATYVFNRLMLR